MAGVGCGSTGKRIGPPAQAANLAGSPITLAATNELNPAWLQPGTAPFTLGPGDRLEIEIIGNRDSRAITSVGPDGKIYYYLLPGMNVWGLTLAESRDLLQKELGKYLTEP